MAFIKKLNLRHRLLVVLNLIYYLMIFLFMLLTWSTGKNFEKLPIQELTQNYRWTEIFFQNITSSFFIIILGIVSFGFLSIFISLYNMYLFFLAINTAYISSESYLYTFFVIMTHGLIEISL
jgi:stage II sporulation protein M